MRGGAGGYGGSNPDRNMKRLLVIGGGLAGLSAAWEAKRAGATVRLLEIAPQIGGVIQSRRENGYLTEAGPNTLLVNDANLISLLHELGLENEIVEAAPAARERFVVREGKLVPVPMSPGQFLASSLFSVPAKLRMLGEPLAKPRPADAPGEESLADFARRRLGGEAFTYGLEPLVAGVFAGDPDKLAAQYAFPKLPEMEAKHGSLARGAWSAMRAKKSAVTRRLISFHDGMAAIPRALAAALGDALESAAELTALEKNPAGEWLAGWTNPSGAKRENFDGVVLAAPAYALAKLPLPATLAAQLQLLAGIEYPPVTAVLLGYPRHGVGHPLDGFGALVPRVEKFSILGVLFSSTLFPGRAPTGQVLLTVFVGGARQPELAGLPDDELTAKVTADLTKLLGVSAPPTYRRIVRWPRAIPQYNLGHGAMLGAIDAAERAWPGLALAGSYRGGVSVPQCLATGRAAGRRALNLSPNAAE